MIFDDKVTPIDYIFLELNKASEKILRLTREEIIGRKVTKVLPGISEDPVDWINLYGQVALTKEPNKFERYSQDIVRWFSINAYSPVKDYFASIFEDITERKEVEEKLHNYQNILEKLVEERTKELKKATKNLRDSINYSLVENAG